MRAQVSCFDVDARVVPLDELLRWCREECGVDRALMAFRMERRRNKWMPCSSDALAFAESAFAGQIMERRLASGWPGTRLTGRPGLVLVVDFDERVERLIVEIEPVLAKWLHSNIPSLPEDLCLYRQGRDVPNLITVTHEEEGWILTTASPSMMGVSPSVDYGTRQAMDELIGRGDRGGEFIWPWCG